MSTAKTPLFHVVKREGSFARGLLVRIAAIALALIVCAVIIVLLTGMNPLNVYGALINGAVGTSRRMWITLRDSAILLCISFAVTALHFVIDLGALRSLTSLGYTLVYCAVCLLHSVLCLVFLSRWKPNTKF